MASNNSGGKPPSVGRFKRVIEYAARAIGKNPPETLGVLVIRTFLKSTAVLFAALSLLGFAALLADANFGGFAEMVMNLKREGCATNGAYAAYAVALACLGLLVVSSQLQFLELIARFVLKSSTEMLGHLTIAGLGFALVAKLQTSMEANLVGVFLLWFVAGWMCFGISAAFESKITKSKHNYLHDIVVTVLSIALFVAGWWILRVGVGLEMSARSFVNCGFIPH